MADAALAPAPDLPVNDAPVSTQDPIPPNDDAIASMIKNKPTLLSWCDRMLIPTIQHLLANEVRRAVEQAENPLRTRIQHLERELDRMRKAVLAAVDKGAA
jgi:hypothetical protein